MAENERSQYDVVYSSVKAYTSSADEGTLIHSSKIGLNIKQTVPSHYVDSVVAVMLDAVNHYNQTLTKRKFVQQAAFFPTVMSFSETPELKLQVSYKRGNI